MSVRSEADPPRGVLPGPPPQAHRRILPSPRLAPLIAHFWWVRWQVAAPTVAATVPHPCVHLVCESGSAEFVGVHTRRFTRQLIGVGEVLGVKFRPGVLQAIDVSAPTWTDQRIASSAIWPTLALPNPTADLITRISTLESELSARLAPLHPHACAIRDLVERIEHERVWLRAEQIAAHLGVSLRTAQRRFRRHVGVSPKWVIRRYRLIEAADALRLDPTRSLADLALDLGYFDQSHFIRDFTALIGQTPRVFAAAAKAAG